MSANDNKFACVQTFKRWLRQSQRACVMVNAGWPRLLSLPWFVFLVKVKSWQGLESDPNGYVVMQNNTSLNLHLRNVIVLFSISKLEKHFAISPIWKKKTFPDIHKQALDFYLILCATIHPVGKKRDAYLKDPPNRCFKLKRKGNQKNRNWPCG